MAGRGPARGSHAKEGVGLGGLETEQPGFWEEEARPVGQPVGPPRETEAGLRMGPQATSSPTKAHGPLCPCAFPQRHSVTRRHTPELNFALSTLNGLPQRPPAPGGHGCGPEPSLTSS